MMQRGVSLIELAIALFIGALLSVLLFSVLSQANKSLVTVDSIASADINVTTFYDRFERDITGAFIPAIGDPDLADKAFAQQLKQAQEQEEAAAQPQQQKTAPPPKKSVKSASLQDIQIKKVFVYEEKEKNLALFSFITDNPISGYQQAKPRIVRVIYALKREPRTSTYALWRKESQKLGIKKDEQAREYRLLTNIKSLRLELLAPKAEEKETPEKDKKVGVEETKKSAPPLVAYNLWPVKPEAETEKTQEKKEEKTEQKIGHDLPQFVKVHLQYQDPQDKRVKLYEFIFPILCFRAPSQKILGVQLIHKQREEQKKQLAEQQTQQDKQRAAAGTTSSPAVQPPSAPAAQKLSPAAGLAGMMGTQSTQQRRNTVGS